MAPWGSLVSRNVCRDPAVLGAVSKTGLVLGAGGATAWIFHLAVLETLRGDAGLDPHGADLIVGTSAGASLAASIKAGVDLEVFREMATRPPSDVQRRAMMNELKAAKKTIIPLSVGMARHLLPGGEGATMALAGMLPPGWFPTGWIASLPGMGSFDRWPDGLWIPAVGVPRGNLVVFGRDRHDVSVDVAVGASSSVPGMFRPQMIDDELFVDGGVKSSTHADLLLTEGMDRVVVSAPMSRPGGGVFARNAKRQLGYETSMLRAAGVDVVVIEPGIELAQIARGYPRRRPEAASEIARYAVAATRVAAVGQ